MSETTGQIAVSGIKPSGKLHIGNYLGGLRNFISLQDQFQCYFFIADLHSLTTNYSAEEKQKQVFELAVDMLASGLDPDKCTLFKQSDVLEHTSLSWIFSTITQMGELERMTQYKDFIARGHSANAGLFTYPILQAADILLYKPVAVPVGDDQTQHIELTRDLAKRFNNRFGETFPVPKALYTKTPRIMSLMDPSKKMSKSLGDAHCIYLSDEPEMIQKKLAKAVTATNTSKKEMPPGVKNLFMLFENFGTTAELGKFKKQYQNGSIKYSELKKALSEIIAKSFFDFRGNRNKLQASPDQVHRILKTGSSLAEAVAKTTLAEVKTKIGIN